MYDYIKSTNVSFRTIYKTVYEAFDSTWNMTSVIMPLIEDYIDIIEKNNATPARIPRTSAISEWSNIAFFEELLLSKNADWSTEAVGSFFIKPLKNIAPDCRSIMMSLLNDLFTIPNHNISLPDIAMVYTAKDFRVLDTEGHFEDSQQLNSSLKACFEDVKANSFMDKSTGQMYINKELENSAKYMEPSPCLNETKFPKCHHYCTWHKSFFKDFPKIDFLTIMKYGLPQRKIRCVIMI